MLAAAGARSSGIPIDEGRAMPVKIVKGKGPKPYRIVERKTGKTVGRSRSKAKAAASARKRNQAYSAADPRQNPFR